jgi:type 1 glutamine amidotransferase
MMMTIDYKRGRIFHTPMGHDDESWECVGLMTTFLRGAEWAATKKVTIPIPEDFPTERFISKRKFD